ncbi:uncharacterized protein BKCO1_2000223 [Diplodia corticola]|uniref:Uncharacterized protein n=1 Tax=Diplodia corticola TaxID=236234 RepID=A0A1J9S4K1_9PEZI|nr:uncharacterized protein BKCO1_2000223 [Diplodia corticola]OJD39883.1 hypothetical protein BKCO1_2000223 [Diplodia corticola]
MASTPPPPERIHTPPAPYLGSRHDDWEPYSPPRRSSRVAAQRSRHAISQVPPQGLEVSKKRPAPRSARAFTPIGSGDMLAPTSGFAASPPASPSSSPQKRPSAKKAINRVMFDDQLPNSDTDSDPFVTSSRDSLAGVLPTPSKTPSKKDKARPLSAFAQTARILFHDRPANIDDAMPSPRKNRKNKKHTTFTLPSFMDECDDGAHERIEIYTDFRERVPSLNDEEDNPFVTKKPDENDAPFAGPSVSPRAAKRHLSKEDEDMDRRARNGEGFVSVFRGKKIFTEFKESSDDSGSDSDGLVGTPTRRAVRSRAASSRAVSSTAHRRVTRSSIQPRLLFPTEEQKRARETAAAKAAEEDSTDVDASVLLATPRKHAHKARAPRSVPAEAREVTPEPASESTAKTAANTSTPDTQRFFEPFTPPPSRTTRASAKRDVNFDLPEGPVDVEADPSGPTQNGDQEPKPVFAPMARPAKRSPFDQWRRTKVGARSVSGTKREGDSLEAASVKRTRSSARASTPTTG